MQQGQRFTYLDLLRGFAALAVLVVHYRWFYALQPEDWNSSFAYPLPLHSVLHILYYRGGLAVELFWLLSGVIFTIKYGTANPIEGTKFWIWRVARLYPLHLATLLLVTSIQIVSIAISGQPKVYGNFDAYHFFLQLLMASNWGLESSGSYNGPVWSVSVEILIYIVFFLYVKSVKPRLSFQLAISVLFGAVSIGTDNSIATCGSLFFLGGAIPQAFEMVRRFEIPHFERICAIAFSVAACCILFASWYWGIRIPDRGFYYVVFPLVLIAALALDYGAPPVPGAFGWISGTTYSTYLMHMPIIIATKIWLDQQYNRIEILSSNYMLLTYLFAVIGISVLVSRFFERPAQQAIQGLYLQMRQRSRESGMGLRV